MKLSHLPQRLPAFTILCVLLGLLSARHGVGQATKETAVQAVRLNLFAVGSYDHPQYGPSNVNYGFIAGGGIGFNLHHVHRIEPALEVRYSYNNGSDVEQTVLGGGIRVMYHVAHFHPYGDFMYGSGNIYFNKPNPVFPNYKKDDSAVLTFGGGLDYDLTPNWAARFDIQQQKWNLSQGGIPFYPTSVSLGARYIFRFHNKYGME